MPHVLPNFEAKAESAPTSSDEDVVSTLFQIEMQFKELHRFALFFKT